MVKKKKEKGNQGQANLELPGVKDMVQAYLTNVQIQASRREGREVEKAKLAAKKDRLEILKLKIEVRTMLHEANKSGVPFSAEEKAMFERELQDEDKEDHQLGQDQQVTNPQRQDRDHDLWGVL